jgi:UDP-N-acetylmuramate dehydrogenase
MIHRNFSLQKLNTFGIEASAHLFAAFDSVELLQDLLDNKELLNQQRFILGGGSNILLTQNFPGVVLKNEIPGIHVLREDDAHFYVKAGAGVNWHELVMHTVANKMAGLENLALIPGCVGAGPMQNIGAYGVELKDVFHSLEALHIEDKTIHTFSAQDCEFGYRESIFKRREKDHFVILNVTFKLNRRAILHTSYGSIEEELEKMHIDNIEPHHVAQAVINIRSSKLPNPKELGNAGSFFKNPVVPVQVYDHIAKDFNHAPCFPVNESEVKIPAGWLIEAAGWKGKVIDRCGVHSKQALVIVNHGGASGKEILELSQRIIDDIEEKFRITLEREVNII